MRQSPKDKKVKERRARSNLKKFDIDKIKAELASIESESLRIDPHSKPAKNNSNNNSSSAGQSPSAKGQRELTRPVFAENTMEMQPDNSHLLHKVLRTKKKYSHSDRTSKDRTSVTESSSSKAQKNGKRAPLNSDKKNRTGLNQKNKLDTTTRPIGLTSTKSPALSKTFALKVSLGSRQQRRTPVAASSGAKSIDFKKPNNPTKVLSYGGPRHAQNKQIKKIDGFSRQPVQATTQNSNFIEEELQAKPKKKDYRLYSSKLKLNNPGIQPQDSEAIGARGLSYANKFHNHTKKIGTNLNKEIAKNNLFSRSMQLASDSGLNMIDEHDFSVVSTKTLANNHNNLYNQKKHKRTLSKKKRFNKKSNKPKHKMIGGVQHYNTSKSKLRRALSYKSVKIATFLIIALLAGSIVLFTNLQNINIHLAQNRSGLEITPPSYTPDGYSLQNKIHTEVGKVIFNFTADDKSYSVAQSSSDWDSSALLNNKVIKETEIYSTYTDRGLTIYIYDGKATWVNQGKTNEIIGGTANLDDEDLVRIAGSM